MGFPNTSIEKESLLKKIFTKKENQKIFLLEERV
jgi:hypothetical protein